MGLSHLLSHPQLPAFPPAFSPTAPSWSGKESGPDRDGGVRERDFVFSVDL